VDLDIFQTSSKTVVCLSVFWQLVLCTRNWNWTCRNM